MTAFNLILGGIAAVTVACALRSRNTTNSTTNSGLWKLCTAIGCLICLVGALVAPFFDGEENSKDVSRRDAMFESYGLSALVDSSLSQVTKRPLRVALYYGVISRSGYSEPPPLIAQLQQQRHERLSQLLSGPGLSCKSIRLDNEATPEEFGSIFEAYDLVIVADGMNGNFLSFLTQIDASQDDVSEKKQSCRFALLYSPYAASQLDPLLHAGTIVSALLRRSGIPDSSLALPKSKEEAIQRRFLLLDGSQNNKMVRSSPSSGADEVE